MTLMAALVTITTVYGGLPLARLERLSDDSQVLTAAMSLTDVAVELERLVVAAHGAMTGHPVAGAPDFRAQLAQTERSLAKLNLEIHQDPLLDGVPLASMERQLRRAIVGTRSLLSQPGEQAAIAALVSVLERITPEFALTTARLRAEAARLNAAHMQSMRSEHSVLTGVLLALSTYGFVLLLMLCRQTRRRQASEQAVQRAVDDLHNGLQELRRQNVWFQATLDNMSQALCVADGRQRLVFCNAGLGALFGIPQDRMRVGARFGDVFSAWPGADAEAVAVLDGIRLQQERLDASGQAGAFVRDLPDGRVISVSQRPMPDGGWVATYEDITDRRQVEAQIRFLAWHDALTGLANRAALTAQLAALSRQQSWHGERLAIIAINLDHFRSINETLGREAGDELLRLVADRLRRAVQEADFLARSDSDVFVILSLAGQHPDEAEQLTRRVLRVLATPFQIRGRSITVSASAGVAISGGAEGADLERLLSHAEAALDWAKAQERGGMRFYDAEVDARIRARRAMECDLRHALEQEQFRLVYQPILDLGQNRVVGFEALVRWNHPKRGVVSPLEFIPLAEELGVITEIGRWLIRQACRDAAAWPDGFWVSVNLSAAQLQEGGLSPVIEAALTATGLAPNRLVLEITETVLLRDDERIVSTLHGLRQRGIRIALDDFGTGFSSLRYLVSFPFDKIKIDQSFVREMRARPECRVIVESIVTMATELGIPTTAEGVETEEQLALVRAVGCTEVQGFFYDRPRPAAELSRWLTAAPEPV